MTGAGLEPAGALLVDKPAGPTSHDVVAFARRLLKTPRVGHTGTLDPLATGLLVLLVGHATRLSRFLVADEKEYVADVRLGIATPTYDAQSLGEALGPKAEADPIRVPPDDLARALARFRGTFRQTPPPFSAKKVGGTRAYAKARRNEAVELEPVDVTVHELELLDPPASNLQLPASNLQPPASNFQPPTSDLVRLRVVASAGFYVRSLAHDLGQVLGCGAHLEALRRTRAGRFRIEDSATLDQLQADPDARERIIPVNTLLADFPAVTLTDEGLRRAANGNPLTPAHLERGDTPLLSEGGGSVSLVRVLGRSGEALAVAERRPDGLLHPLVVLR
jgi:tRNA pseudouridine55 synthase